MVSILYGYWMFKRFQALYFSLNQWMFHARIDLASIIVYFSTMKQARPTCATLPTRGESINKQGLLISVIRRIRFISALAEGEGP